MDEVVEPDAAAEAVAEELREGAGPVTGPKAYVFDGWGMIPLEF